MHCKHRDLCGELSHDEVKHSLKFNLDAQADLHHCSCEGSQLLGNHIKCVHINSWVPSRERLSSLILDLFLAMRM